MKKSIEQIQRIRLGYDIIANVSRSTILVKLQEEMARNNRLRELEIKKEFNEQFKANSTRILQAHQANDDKYNKISDDYATILGQVQKELARIRQVNKV